MPSLLFDACGGGAKIDVTTTVDGHSYAGELAFRQAHPYGYLMLRAAPTRRRSWFFAVLAILAMTAQLAAALAPLAEGREGPATVHVESSGAPSHHQHNDATCAACQARAIHGMAPRASARTIESTPRATVSTQTACFITSADLNPSVHPRAPPFLI